MADASPLPLRSRFGRSPWLLKPLQPVEWALEWLVYGFKQTALLDLLQIAASFSIAFGVINWYLELPDRRRDRLYSTWSVLSSSLKERTHGARNEAMADLAARGFSLAGLALPDSSFLERIDLRGIDLRRARLRHVILMQADLGCRRQGWFEDEICSNLSHADLRGANLALADLRGVDLTGADLTGANLAGACLDRAWLVETILDSANVPATDFRNAYIEFSRYRGVKSAELMGLFEGAQFGVPGSSSPDSSEIAFETIGQKHGAEPYLGEMYEDEVVERTRRAAAHVAKAWKAEHKDHPCDTPLKEREGPPLF